MKTRYNICWVVLTCVLSATLSWAQLSTGSLTGVITDPSDAPIPGAKVTLANAENGLLLHADTDSSGRYLFRAVPPASYTLTASAGSFQTQARTGITIEVNQNVTVSFALPLRTTSDAVTITGDAPLLATEDASTGQVLDRHFIDALPVVGRDTMALSYLAPGIVGALNGAHQTGTAGNDFSSSGGPAWTADVLLDGISTTNYEQNGGLLRVQYLPNPDAIEEFKVQTSNFNAEFGFTGATVVNMVMRSGTNSFHGTAYDYLRNSKLDSNSFFANKAGSKLGALHRNNFGANLGGPIRRNKTFFFVDYDGLRQTSQTTASFGVPSAAERTGNFGELCGYKGGSFDSAGRCSVAGGQLWDPYSSTYSATAGGAVRSTYIPFNNMATYMSAGNPNLNGTGYQLPAKPGNLIDPVALKLMQYMPLPNLNVGTASYQYYNNFFGAGPRMDGNDMFDIKIDHRFDDSSSLSGKFGDQHPVNHKYNVFGNAADPATSGFSDQRSWLGGLNYTKSISPTLLLTASYGFTRWWQFLPNASGDYPDVNAITTLGLPAYFADSGTKAFPAVTLGTPYQTGPNGISVGTNRSTTITQGVDSHQGLVTLSWVKGKHELKFGGEVRWHRINYFIPDAPAGAFTFAYTGTSQNPTSTSGGDPMASFLTGVGTGNSGSYEISTAYSTTNWQWGGFLQDNYKITPNLTINIGLRYDLTLPRKEKHNRANWLDPTVVSPLQVPGLGTLHGGEMFTSNDDRQNYEPDYNDWQPRVGFAWKAANKTVIRSGYGIYYTASRSAATGAGGPGHSGFTRVTTWITSYNSDAATPWGRLSDPFPVTGPSLPPGSALGLLNDVGFSANGPYRNANVTPYEQTWNFDIQRELPGSMLVDVAYVGKKGTHLYFGGDANYNILPIGAESLSQSQVASNLLTFVKNPFNGVITDPLSTLSKPTIQAYQLLLPFPQFTTFGGDSPGEANSNYHALQARVEKRMSHGLQLLATYTYSKAIDDASVSQDSFNTGKTSLQDPNRRYLKRSLSEFNDTHVFQFSHVYQLPFGRGKQFGSNWNPVVNGILGGWQVSGIWTFDSGRPLMLGLTGGFNLPTYGAQRPDLVGNPSRNTGADWMTNYFASNAVFAKPVPYAIGNSPRVLNGVSAPGQANANISVSKEFSLSSVREGMRLQLMCQTLNALNHPQFAAPNLSLGSASFGSTTALANLPRELEMVLKLRF